MGGKEAVVSPTIAVHNVDQHADLGVMGGTPASHTGLDKDVVDGTGKQDTQAGTAHYQRNLLYGVIVLHHHIEQ